MTGSWRTTVAIGALCLAALHAQLFPRPRRYSAADDVPPARAAERFDCLSGLLPPFTMVSYAPAVPLDTHSDPGLRSIRNFQLAQYALAPAILTDKRGSPFVLVDAGVDGGDSEPTGVVLADCGAGIRLIQLAVTK